MIVSGHTFFSTAWFLDPWILDFEETVPYHILDAYSKYIPSSGKPYLSLPGCHQIGTVTVSLNGNSIFFYQVINFRMVQKMVRPADSMIMGQLSHFSVFVVSSLVRNSTMLNTMTVNKAFCEFTCGGFGKSIMLRNGKSIVSIPLRINHCLFHRDRGPIYSKLPLDHW